MNKQRGAVLLASIAVTMLCATAFVYAHMAQRYHQRILSADIDYLQRLQQARAALLVYALTPQQNRPRYLNAQTPLAHLTHYQRVRVGELPCPDVNGNGRVDLPDFIGTKCRVHLGFLPWKTLGLSKPVGARRIWYAVDSAVHNRGSDATEPKLNPATPITLRLNNQPMVALVLAENTHRAHVPRTGNAQQDLAQVLPHLAVDASHKRFTNNGNFHMRGVSHAHWLHHVGMRVLHDVHRWLSGGWLADTQQGHYVPMSAQFTHTNCRPMSTHNGAWGFVPQSCNNVRTALTKQPCPSFRRPDNSACSDALCSTQSVADKRIAWLFRNGWHEFIEFKAHFQLTGGYHVYVRPRGQWQGITLPTVHSHEIAMPYAVPVEP